MERKKLKRLFASLVSMAIVMSTLVVPITVKADTVQVATDGSSFYRCAYENGVLTGFSGTSPSKSNPVDVVIPSGLGITAIADNAFSGKTGIKRIVIPEGVTSIGSNAFFNCTSMESVTLPSTLTSIGSNAFGSCSSLRSIEIPAGVTTISDSTFSSCKNLETVVIPSTVTSIGSKAFYGCAALTSVTIPSIVTSIGSGAFNGCKALTSVVIPEGVTSIGDSTFSGCNKLETVVIPSTVTSIGSDAFTGCTALTSVTIPSIVTSIGDTAFYRCPLESITIPSIVESIGDYAFGYCTQLTSVTIPSSVTSMGSFAFTNCTSLTSVVIPNSVTSIGSNTFNGCTSLESVVIPNSVTSIEANAFKGCTALESITIPEGVESIGNYVFNGCTKLTSITLPTTLETIGTNAFKSCSALKTIYYNGTEEDWEASGLAGNSSITALTEANATVSYITPEPTPAPAATYFKTYSVSLGGMIGVNFYIDLNDYSAENAVVEMTWDKGHETVSLKNITPDDKGRYMVSCKVAAKEINDIVTAVLKVDGEEIATNAHSVADYANYVLNATSGFDKLSALQEVARSILIYGAKAQAQFGYNTDNPADYGLDYTLAEPEINDAPAYSGTAFRDYGFTTKTASLVLVSETIYRLYFTVDDEDIFANTTVKLNGKTLGYTREGTDTVYYDIANIAAKDITNSFDLTFENSDNSTTFTVTPKTYINAAPSLGKEKLTAVVRALYRYNQAAKTYFENN